jgi:hypothetical protein
VPPEEADRPIELRFDAEKLARRVLLFCILAEIAFVVLDYYINYGKLVDIGAIRRMFNIAREDGLASWFGTTQTLMAALTLWFIYLVVKRRPGPRWRPLGWLVLAVFFTYMAIDDGAQLHERLGSTFKAMWRDLGQSLDFFPSYTWQLVLGPAFGALGLFVLAFLWRQLGERRSRVFLVLALSCWVVAVGMDFVEGLDEDHRWNLYTRIAEGYELGAWTEARFDKSAYDALRHFSKSIEEAIEMLGMSILWFLFLRHLAVVAWDLRVRFLRGESSR